MKITTNINTNTNTNTNQNIQIEIGNPDGGGLELTFDDFVLELSDGCSLDFVQVIMMTVMMMMMTATPTV